MPAGGAADHGAVPGQRTLQASRVGLGVEGEPAQRAAEELVAHGAQPTTSSRRCNTPPTPKASGKTNAAIATEVRQPRSLAIMVDTAMQGMKRGRVANATSTWAGLSNPADCMAKKPAAPKSRRRKPISSAVLACAGRPSPPGPRGWAGRRG